MCAAQGRPRGQKQEGRRQRAAQRRRRGDPGGALASAFQPQNREKMHFCCLRRAVFVTLLWQPQQTSTALTLGQGRFHPQVSTIHSAE